MQTVTHCLCYYENTMTGIFNGGVPMADDPEMPHPKLELHQLLSQPHILIENGSTIFFAKNWPCQECLRPIIVALTSLNVNCG